MGEDVISPPHQLVEESIALYILSLILVFGNIDIPHLRKREEEQGPHIQFKKRIRNLQHQDMRMIMLMTDQDALARAPHPMLLVMLL